MEKQLLERAANGTMDEVDFEMLKARLHNTIEELQSHIHAINEICDEHEDELKIMDLSLVLVVDSPNEVVGLKAMGLFGRPSFIKEKMIPELLIKLEGGRD